MKGKIIHKPCGNAMISFLREMKSFSPYEADYALHLSCVHCLFEDDIDPDIAKLPADSINYYYERNN